ncbi:oxidoreductase [Paraliobacillus quinghaiensis]|uniref:Oxidoreductase n=1 Tax=Paraliobacillus quinghaiensis TaxID=470815 RepID=A0A917TH05_9BACI|nr:aldo/keto reductase [Paraliobacillus quinghaiensis]GGM22322.1 oxidoreductase [Paraliobacillus quinghaiensis]
MKKNRLGQSNLYVSELGLGCMSLGTNVNKAKEIVTEAIDQGINYLDTADLYDQGENEAIVGKSIKGKRDQIILATKVGNHLNDDGSWFWHPSKAYIKEQVKRSLQRLETDYIDLYQLHGGTIDDPIDETIEAFEDLKQEGVIRYYGISSIRPNVIKEYVKRSSIVSVMMQYSLLDRRPEEEMLNLLAENNISVVTRGALAKGMLSDHAKKVIENKGRDGYLDYSYQELKDVVENLEQIDISGQSLSATSLQYALHHKAVASAVTGVSSVEQLKNNITITNSPKLTDADYQKLQSITKAITYQKY